MKNESSNVDDLSGYRVCSSETEKTVEDQCVVGLNRPSWDEF